MKQFLVFILVLTHVQLASAKELIIISDLDETIREANIENKTKAGLKLLSGVKAYEGLKIIFNEIKLTNPDVKFYYLSNSYPFLYNGDKWTTKNGFPEGTIYQRCLKDKSDEFKPKKLKEIALAHPDAQLILFGDNIEHDPGFYKNFLAETQIKDAQVFIRDARLEFTQDLGVTYFQTEAQITEALEISEATSSAVKNLAFNKLVPKYLLKNLKKRLIKECKQTATNCSEAASRRVLEVIDLLRPANERP
jgi:phosphatidate phosphatase APP1